MRLRPLFEDMVEGGMGQRDKEELEAGERGGSGAELEGG